MGGAVDGDHLAVIGDGKITRGHASVTVSMTIPRPNRYVVGVIPELPPGGKYNTNFAYRGGIAGWGLHDYKQYGIYSEGRLLVPADCGFSTGEIVCTAFQPLFTYPLLPLLFFYPLPTSLQPLLLFLILHLGILLC